MSYKKIEYSLRICAERLGELAGGAPEGPELESRLVAGLVLLIVSEYEEMIEATFVRRAEQCRDVALVNYVRAMVARRFRSPDIGKITETLGYFGGDYKKRFSEAVLNKTAQAAWYNIMQASTEFHK